MSPRPKKLSKIGSNVADARQKILEAARDLFVEHGFHHTSVDDIAVAAGLSRATCYYQFKSKAGILDAVIADAQERAPVNLRSRIAHPVSMPLPVDNLRSLVVDVCLIWEQDRPLFRRVMGLGEVDPELRQIIDARQGDRSAAIDAISHRLIARHSRRSAVEALWVLTSFSVFDSTRSHASFEVVIEMLTAMAVTVVDPERMWKAPGLPARTVDSPRSLSDDE
jgi:AcrR family transcriptional regulator